jgi:hypothetical protein
MFAKLAKVRIFGTWRNAPGQGRLTHSNDNRLGFRLVRPPLRSERHILVCRWRPAAESGQIECHWEIESADAHGDAAGIPVHGPSGRSAGHQLRDWVSGAHGSHPAVRTQAASWAQESRKR